MEGAHARLPAQDGPPAVRMTLRIASVALVLALVALAAPAWSARVAAARVGQHPQFTRIVFELDSQAGYRVERSVGSDGRPQVVVTLAAALAPNAPHKIRSSSSLLDSVTLEQRDDRTIATIHLRSEALPVKEMILANPPRIVLDVVGTDTELAARAAKPPPRKAEPEVAKTQPAPAPKPAPQAEAKPAPQPEPKPAPVAQAPKPVPRVEEPEPTPSPEPKPAEPKPAPLAQAPTPQPQAPPPAPEAPKPVAQAPEAAKPQESEAERAAREAMDRRLAAVREAAEQRKQQLEQEREKKADERQAAQERLAEQRKRQEEQEAAARPPASAAPEQPGEEGPSPYLVGALGGLLVFALVLALVLIRRRTLPKDLDVTAFSEPEDEEPEIATGETEAPTFSRAGEPRAGVDEKRPPLSAPGLFDESDDSEKGDSEMQPHAQDLPSARNEPFTSAPSADVSALIAELERRMSALESRLQESNAARERLERQVAAQSEELRVQRAAIARTQRALRGLSRSEEEQATEPALRD
jgi:hypothetical protein